MPSQPHKYRVQFEPGGLRDQLAADHDWQAPASAYRLMQAEALLREMGYVCHDDGTWHLPDEPAPHPRPGWLDKRIEDPPGQLDPATVPH
jgi:hypothetical protein